VKAPRSRGLRHWCDSVLSSRSLLTLCPSLPPKRRMELAAGSPLAEPVRGILRRQSQRRGARRGSLRLAARSEDRDRGLEKHLLHRETTLEPEVEDSRRVRGGMEDIRQPDSHNERTDERGAGQLAVCGKTPSTSSAPRRSMRGRWPRRRHRFAWRRRLRGVRVTR